MYHHRKLSPIERFYVGCDRHRKPYHTPCINQMMLEGEGQFDEAAWQQAVEAASLKNPGSRLVLSGKLGFSKWRAGNQCARLRILENNSWDGMSNINCPFEDMPLPPFDGPTTEVVLLKTTPLRVIIRTHHGTMDGRGTQTFVDDVFRVLNGQDPVGENTGMNDMALFKKIKGGIKYGEPLGQSAMPPTGLPRGHTPGSHWTRRHIAGKHRQVLAKAGLAIAELVHRFDDQPVLVQLPVDMRPHVPEVRSTANLTGAIVVKVTRGMSVEQWEQAVRGQIQQGKEAELPYFSTPVQWLSWFPLSLLQYANERIAQQRAKSGLYRTNAVISNLGRLPIDTYAGGGFKCHHGLFIPPDFSATAFFLTLSGSPSGIELVLRVPHNLSSNNRMEEALDYIVHKFQSGTAIAA